ncbi:hypothetical protein [Gordonia sputi]|uniref:hypothetical protein n=1 Tax=Gordonia sputi TaxID=36823 RepID=UPI0036AE4F9D
MDLDDALDELYGCAPGEFVSRRRELTRTARAADAPEIALDISRARKPTQVAWLLNQWMRRSPTDLDPLLGVADELREAQRRSSAELLRRLSTRRRDVVQTALEHLRSFAAEIGAGMSTTVEREAVQTLRAAIGDEQVAELLRRGRLVTAMEYSGFGPAGLVALADSPAPADEATAEMPEPSPSAAEGSTATRAAEIDAARALLDRHTADVDSATVELDNAQRSVDDAERTAADLEDRVARVRAELDRAEQEQRFAQRAAETARSRRDEAATALEAASDARSRAQQRLDELRLNDLSGDADRD